MKSDLLKLAVLAVVILLVAPGVSLAVWWNPISWVSSRQEIIDNTGNTEDYQFKDNDYYESPEKTKPVATSTTSTVASSSVAAAAVALPQPATTTSKSKLTAAAATPTVKKTATATVNPTKTTTTAKPSTTTTKPTEASLSERLSRLEDQINNGDFVTRSFLGRQVDSLANSVGRTVSDKIAGLSTTTSSGSSSSANTFFAFALSDETTALVTSSSTVKFRMPYAATLTAVRLGASTAPTGATIIVNMKEEGTTVFSTRPSIDASEKTSTTAATAYAFSDTSLADDAEITLEVDQVGSTVAGAGLKMYIYVTPQ